MSVNFDPKATIKMTRTHLRRVLDDSKRLYNEGVNYSKNLGRDTVSFVKQNPKTIGKYAAIGVLVGAGVAMIVKGIKSVMQIKDQNKILTKAVGMQRETINNLKEHIAMTNEMMAAKDDTIAAMQK